MNEKKTAVCTLFEKNYHLGLGVFANSLYYHGYRGTLYAGYRGNMPPWAATAGEEADKSRRLEVAEGMDILFIPLETQEHLTNTKPDFMLDLWTNHCPEAEQLFYFDPDIVIKTAWTNFCQWAKYGVALCEDMNSPVPLTHPLRQQWKEYYAPHGINVEARDPIYVNGGFVGVDARYRDFLLKWKKIQDLMKLQTGNPQQIGIGDRWNLFQFTDQDALNVAKDVYPDLSIMSKHAMDFESVGYVMSHAAGHKKPWTKNHLHEIFINSSQPANTDKLYWQHASTPIRPHSPGQIMRKKLAIKFSSLLGRFVRRS